MASSALTAARDDRDDLHEVYGVAVEINKKRSIKKDKKKKRKRKKETDQQAV